jgi:glycerol-3-phosphate dehydrogenase
MDGRIELDVAIFGGGAAGLWLLDELRRRNSRVLLLEAFDLGRGQTIASQGIIHGGLKYTLAGLFSPSARAIREMPGVWRKSLAGEAEPDLSSCRLRSQFCYLWRTRSLSSRLAMIGAKTGLQVTPEVVDESARPPALAHVSGPVARLDEQVIEPDSFLEALASRNRSLLLSIDVESGTEFEVKGGEVQTIRLICPTTGAPLDLMPKAVVFVAGSGNEQLRSLAGLRGRLMQRRPLHMVMARGELPELNGHCVDGASTRITITSTSDVRARRVWQIGGRVAEDGVRMERTDLIAHAKQELADTLPGVDLRATEWSTYRVDRAEASSGGARPEDASMIREGNIITAWPTKLALVPKLVEQIVDTLADSAAPHSAMDITLSEWPRPDVALPPWETEQQWFADH